MNIKTKLGGAVLTGALALGTMGALSSAQAQDRGAAGAVKPAKSIKPGQPDITLDCCRCVDGREQKPIDISTGVAKWSVSKTPTAAPAMPAGGWGAGVPVVPSNMSPQVVPGNIGPNPAAGTWTSGTGAAWLQPTAAGSAPMWNAAASSYNNGHWTYVLKIRIPNCTIPQKVKISGSVAADDAARVYLDSSTGTQTLVNTPTANFGAPTNFSADVNLATSGVNSGFTKPGIYYLRVEMDNLGGGPSAISLKGSLSSVCSDKLSRNQNNPKGKEIDPECPDCDTTE